MTTRADIVAEARSWIGTPYEHQQRSKGLAVDCIGVLIGTGRSLGLVAGDFDVTGYGRRPDGTSLIDHCERHMTRIDQAAMQPGDAVVLAFDGDPQHFGMLVDYRHGGLAIVHAMQKYGRVVETRLLFGSAPRALKFVAAYRLPGMAA
jgi:cell wall-associated NlpC family hydrolase